MRQDALQIISTDPITGEQSLQDASSQFARGSFLSAAQEKLSFLAEASRILASSLDYETTLASVARLVVPNLADWCVVDMAGPGGTIQRLAAAHVDPEKMAWAKELQRRYPPRQNGQSGVANVLRTGVSECHSDITDKQLVASARDADELAILRELGLTSVLLVPLATRGRILGVITFVSGVESGRIYTKDDLALAEELARRAAIAVDNARLYQQAEEARRLHQDGEEQLMLLAEAAQTLISSLQLSDLLPAILDLSDRLFSADAYALWRQHPDTGSWQTVSQSGLSEEYTRATLLSSPQSQPLLDSVITIENVTQQHSLGTRQAAYTKEGIHAVLILPLNIHGQKSGTLAFYYRQPHTFSEREVRAATALANLAASAIGTTELYEEQNRLRAAAEAEVIERQRAEEKLRQIAAEIAEIHKRDHAIATTLQDALQPPPPTNICGLALKHHYEAALDEAGVGGDFYDVFPTENGCTVLVVGDLSGKGLAAAAQVATVRNMLRYALYNDGSIADAVTKLNRTLARNSLLTGFATLFVGIHDSAAGTLSYVSCGQEPGLLRRAATGEVEELQATGPILGTWETGEFTEGRARLEPGDVLALFTDGLTEVGPDRTHLLGIEGITALLHESAATSDLSSALRAADTIAARLIDGVNLYAQRGPRDDVCLLVAVVE